VTCAVFEDARIILPGEVLERALPAPTNRHTSHGVEDKPGWARCYFRYWPIASFRGYAAIQSLSNKMNTSIASR
jgi:hypothetical protein